MALAKAKLRIAAAVGVIRIVLASCSGVGAPALTEGPVRRLTAPTTNKRVLLLIPAEFSTFSFTARRASYTLGGTATSLPPQLLSHVSTAVRTDRVTGPAAVAVALSARD